MLQTQLIIGKQIVLSNLNDVSVCPNGADILLISAPLELENKIVQKKSWPRGDRENPATLLWSLKEEALNENEKKDTSQETSLNQEEKPDRNNSSTKENVQKGPTNREEKITNLTDTDCITVLSCEYDEDESLSKQEKLH